MKYLIIVLILSSSTIAQDVVSAPNNQLDSVLKNELLVQITDLIAELETEVPLEISSHFKIDSTKLTIVERIIQLHNQEFFDNEYLVRSNSLLAYLRAHELLISLKSSWPLSLQLEYNNKLNQFLKKIKNLSFQKINNLSKYDIDDCLQRYYYNFIVEFIQNNKSFWQEYLIRIINFPKIYALRSGDSVIFNILYSTSFSNFTRKNSMLASNIKVYILYIRSNHKLNNRRIILSTSGYYDNLIVYSYFKNDENKISMIKQVDLLSQTNFSLFNQVESYFSVNDDRMYYGSFFKWNTINKIITMHYGKHYRSYKFMINGQKWQEIAF